MQSISLGVATPAARVGVDAKRTRALLACGAAAGPFFVLVGLAQAFTVPGFDLTRHYLSQLSAGELGWIQIANFVISGLLTIAGAVGVKRALGGGRLGRLGPSLLALYGLGLVAAGVFVADPAGGFPPGAPAGRPEHFSWHSMLHGVAAIVAFTCLFAAGLALAYRFARERRAGWAAYTAITAVVSFVLPWIPNPWGGVVLFVASAIAWVWYTALTMHLAREAE